MKRRQFLASMGASLFLPSLARAQSLAPPKRLIIFFTQHGTVYDQWRIEDATDLASLSENEFSPILQPLHVHRDKLLVVDGVAMLSAELDEPSNEHQIGT